MDINKQQVKDCEHDFASLGFNVFKVTDKTVEAVAAIFCSKCGMFRTKILSFRRELTQDDYTNNTGKTSKQKEQ